MSGVGGIQDLQIKMSLQEEIEKCGGTTWLQPMGSYMGNILNEVGYPVQL